MGGSWVVLCRELDYQDDEEDNRSGEAGCPSLPGLQPLRLVGVMIERALEALRLRGDGPFELAGVDAAPPLELAQEVLLQVGNLRQQPDQRRVDGRRQAVAADAGAAVRAEASAPQVLGVTVGTGYGLLFKHSDTLDRLPVSL